MSHPGVPTVLTNWGKSRRSACVVHKVNDVAGIKLALEAARAQNLSVIPHGAGHSYTDAALNTGEVVIDVSPMRRILAWDPARGVMRVEPGVTLEQMIQIASRDGWWPVISPSTAQVTVGGCAAMNVNGRNSWKRGPFGAHILALELLLANGEILKVAPDEDIELFHACVGSLGLIGLITSITLRLQRIASAHLTIRRRPANSLDEILAALAEEEERSDSIEAWLDGFATGDQLGRGIVTSATPGSSAGAPRLGSSGTNAPSTLERAMVTMATHLARPALGPAIHLANQANYWQSRLGDATEAHQRTLFSYTYWSPAELGGYHSLLPRGVETFHGFVPRPQAKAVFENALVQSQERGCTPIWCVIKLHRRDPFLLSYQVDGFSLELNYQRTDRTAGRLEPLLESLNASVIAAGGRLYLAKDRLLTREQYRRSIGDEVVDSFLRLKQQYDPDARLQSDLYRRVFQPS